METIDNFDAKNNNENKPSFLLEASFYRDRKFLRIRSKEGKAAAFDCLSLLGLMRESDNYRIPNDITENSLLINSTEAETQLAVDAALRVELFKIDAEGFLYAPGLIRRMQKYFNARQQRIDAGKRSAQLRQEKKIIAQQTPERSLNAVGTVVEAEPQRTFNGPNTIQYNTIQSNTKESNTKEIQDKDLGKPKPEKKRVEHPKILGFTISASGDDFEIPKDFQTVPVAQAIEDWLSFKEKTAPYKGLHGIKALFSQALSADATPDFLAWSILHCISHEYQGIHFTFTAEKYLEETGKQPKRTKQMQLQGGGNGRRPLTETINVETVKEMCRQKGLI